MYEVPNPFGCEKIKEYVKLFKALNHNKSHTILKLVYPQCATNCVILRVWQIKATYTIAICQMGNTAKKLAVSVPCVCKFYVEPGSIPWLSISGIPFEYDFKSTLCSNFYLSQRPLYIGDSAQNVAGLTYVQPSRTDVTVNFFLLSDVYYILDNFFSYSFLYFDILYDH